MKKLLFIVLFLISNTLYSQLFIAKTFSFSTIKRGEKWTPFSEKELVNFPIEVDSSDNLIVLHANKLQVYTIYKSNVFINEVKSTPSKAHFNLLFSIFWLNVMLSKIVPSNSDSPYKILPKCLR